MDKDSRNSPVIHISSAVITCRPEHCEEVARRIPNLSGVEIHYIQDGKIVVVLEGPSVGAVGDSLTAIGSIDGVLSASLVFEQVVSLDELGESA